MLTDLQRLDYAEAMINLSETDRAAYLQEKQVTEPTDIEVISQLIVDLDVRGEACEAPAEVVAEDAPTTVTEAVEEVAEAVAE